MVLGVFRKDSLREDGDADDWRISRIGIVVREVGKVNGRAITDGLEAAAGVEMANGGSWVCALGHRAFRVLDGGAEGAGADGLMGGKTVHQLGLENVSIHFDQLNWMIRQGLSRQISVG